MKKNIRDSPPPHPTHAGAVCGGAWGGGAGGGIPYVYISTLVIRCWISIHMSINIYIYIYICYWNIVSLTTQLHVRAHCGRFSQADLK